MLSEVLFLTSHLNEQEAKIENHHGPSPTDSYIQTPPWPPKPTGPAIIVDQARHKKNVVINVVRGNVVRGGTSCRGKRGGHQTGRS